MARCRGIQRRASAVGELDGRATLDLAAPGHAELVRSMVFDGMPQARLKAFGAMAEAVAQRLATSPIRRT